MATNSKRIAVKRLEEDRNGLIEYKNLLQKNITEIKQRLFLTEGALQYLNQLLNNKEAKDGS